MYGCQSAGRSPTTSRCKTALTDRTPCRIETMIVQFEQPPARCPAVATPPRHVPGVVSSRNYTVPCRPWLTRCVLVPSEVVRCAFCVSHTAPATTSKTTAQDGEAHGAHGTVLPRSPQRLTSPRCQVKSDGAYSTYTLYSTATGDSSGNGPSASGVAPSASGPAAALSATATAASASDAA